MKTRKAWVVILALMLLVGCSGLEESVEMGSELEALLPEPAELAGWAVVEGPKRHSPGSLYEYLNGGAERYLTHGFRSLLHVRYQLGNDPLACVTLDAYDMGGELGAFGIYRAARPPQVEVRQWGAEGYRDGAIAAAWNGSLYVHGEVDDERPELIELLERLVVGVCDGVVGGASIPSVLDPLPTKGRMQQSERYVPADLLGHSFLPGGFIATYEIDGQRAELFFSDLGNETAAREALESMRVHQSKWGEVEAEATLIGGGGFRYFDPTLGSGTVVGAGRHIAGIHGELPVETREEILSELVAALG